MLVDIDGYQIFLFMAAPLTGTGCRSNGSSGRLDNLMTVTASSDKVTLLQRLRESQAAFVKAASVPEELAAVCPDATCWSILQITEHLGMTERGMFGRINIAEPVSTEPNLAFDEMITNIGRDRSGKRNAPERRTRPPASSPH